MKNFLWHCGASVLVDDAYSKLDVIAPNPASAYGQCFEKVRNDIVLDEGTIDVRMDTKELARELGNLAIEDDSYWEPVELTRELEEISDKEELIATLEWIVCNAINGKEN